MGSVKVKAPKGFHWMDYEGGYVLMAGDYESHDGAAEVATFEVVEEYDPSRLSVEKGEEWDAIYNAILERTGDKELAAATATAREGSRLGKASYVPPKNVQGEAKQGLEWRGKYGRSDTNTSEDFGKKLASGGSVSRLEISTMLSFFAGHERDLLSEGNTDRKNPDYPGDGLIAWKIYGGDAGRKWAQSVVDEEKEESKKKAGLEKASKEYMEEALKLAKEELPGWAYAKIHQAARGTAGGRRRHAKAGSRFLAAMVLSQLTPSVMSSFEDKDLRLVWNYLDDWFNEHKGDSELRSQIVQAASLLMKEMSGREMKCPSCELMREATNRIEVEKAELKKLNKSSVPVYSPNNSFVFVVEEPNDIDKARGEYLVGQDGRVFNELYLKRLGIKKSDICIVDITQIEWLETTKPREVIALGRVAKNALGEVATCVLPHPKAVRRFGDSGEVERKLGALLKRSGHFLLDLNPPNGSNLETRAEEDTNSQADALIEKQASDGRVLPEQSEKDLSLSLIVPISKADAEKQIVYGIVLDPYQVDSQDDWVPPKAIEETAHRWLAESRVIGLDHSDKADAFPVESYMVPYPSREDYDNAMLGDPHKAYTMPFGDDVVHSGSWVLGTKLGDEEWALVKDGELNAYSIGGYGNRQKTSKSNMPQVEFVELKEER
tara:strand:- start:128 stop:2116 length:1989 start_codon:yes stop_codon:yes gene_type:complete